MTEYSPINPVYYTKTFVEHRWYRRRAGGGPQDWDPMMVTDDHGKPIDAQVREWVNASGAVICNPGTVGFNKQWYDNGTLLCVTVGLTLLYSEGQQYVEPQPAE